MSRQHPLLTVVGGGLAGVEAALAAARLGARVRLVEMRPVKATPQHRTGDLAELVCSNSLGARGETQAKGLLQAELRELGSTIMAAADRASVPAGGALAVDREVFARAVTEQVEAAPGVELARAEQTALPEPPAVIATGPLTSDALAADLARLAGDGAFLHFYDAAAPVVVGDTIDREKVYLAGRYEQSPDYLNCPLTETEYDRWYETITAGRSHTPHDWERLEFFEGCMPIEELARRGKDTPRFGPMKPVGLIDPRTGRRPYAVVQLRREDANGRLWSLVGFQTGLKWGDQKALLETIPGLERAEIARYGLLHRNTYLDSPRVLQGVLETRARPGLFVAGQLAGVEGYLESAAMGLLAGVAAAHRARGTEPPAPPGGTMLAGLLDFVTSAPTPDFQPMNANWGLVPPAPFDRATGKKGQRLEMYRRGVRAARSWAAELGLAPAPAVGAP